MATPRRVVFHHAPNTRSTGTLTLLEELNADYELHLLNMKAGENRQPAYLAINPMGKVPAIEHHGALVTEQVAVYLYLADLYPEVGLTPEIGSALRGPYLRWMAFYGSCFEPAVVDRSLKRDPAGLATSPYGDYDTMLATLTGQLEGGPWMLGEHFTAVDVLWGTALGWTTRFGLVPSTPVVQSYVERAYARPAFARARQKDADWAAAMQNGA